MASLPLSSGLTLAMPEGGNCRMSRRGGSATSLTPMFGPSPPGLPMLVLVLVVGMRRPAAPRC